MSEMETASAIVKSGEGPNVLPYLRGGVPHALLYCIWIGGFVAAAFEALFAVLGLIARGQIVVKLIAAALSVLSVWLSLKESLGAGKLLKNLPEGAEAIGKVLSVRRGLMIVGIGLYGIYILVTAFSMRSGGFLALLISALLGAVLFVPLLWLMTDEIDLMNKVHAEMRSGDMTTDTLRPRRPFVILTVITALGAAGTVWMQSSGLLSTLSLPYELRPYTVWVYVYLIFSVIESALMAANVRSFHKTHSGGASFETVETRRVFGACMLFGAALYSLGSFPSFAAMQRWNIAFVFLLESLGYVLCGLALCKKGIKWLAAAGSALLIAQGVFDLLNLSETLFPSPSLRSWLSFASLVCFVLACACLMLRVLSGRVSGTPCTVLFVAAGVLMMAYRFANSVSLGLFHPSGYVTLLSYAGLIILSRLSLRTGGDAPKAPCTNETPRDAG